MPYEEDIFLTPIRDKIDYVRVLLHAARALLINVGTAGVETSVSIKVLVSKMSRLFVYKDGKFYSISFPLNLQDSGNTVLSMKTRIGTEISSQSISSALSILEDQKFLLKPSPIDYFLSKDSLDGSGLYLLEEMFLFEPSYIRYDLDPKHEKGRRHPLHHLDVNYSPYGTYKIGLEKAIGEDYFVDILNTLTDCSFIEGDKPRASSRKKSARK